MDWLDLTLALLIGWIALDLAVVAALMSRAAKRDLRAQPRAPRPAEYTGLRLVSSRPQSARTRT